LHQNALIESTIINLIHHHWSAKHYRLKVIHNKDAANKYNLAHAYAIYLTLEEIEHEQNM